MQRWFPLALALIIGIAAGLVYGWVLSPIEYVDTTPETLRPDYRADYVLTVAEAYQSDQDAELAVRRLAILGSQSPGELAGEALQQARSYGFAESDILLLQKFTTSMQAWQPSAGNGNP
jgi:alpha-D-ribose 1-methylphosphonate 5-triphosphate synthase subunit PhnI